MVENLKDRFSSNTAQISFKPRSYAKSSKTENRMKGLLFSKFKLYIYSTVNNTERIIIKNSLRGVTASNCKICYSLGFTGLD